MNGKIVESSAPITLVGGGDLRPEDLRDALAVAPFLAAADGGAGQAVACGETPEVVIGDLDSLTSATRAALPEARILHIAEQDSVDFDKAVRSLSAPFILGVGFLGARLDHQLAALNVLVRHADRALILIGAHEVVFHAPPALSLDLVAGDLVSLMPFAQVTGTSQGLRWPIDGLTLSPDGQIGTSNQAMGRVTLRCDAPGLLVMVPRCRLAVVLSVLPQTSRWPVRAAPHKAPPP